MKKVLSVVLAVVVLCSLSVTAFAEHLTGGDGWQVTYTADGDMTDTYSSKEYIDQISALQPGDDITVTVKLTHENKDDADWYIWNEVIKSLEEGDATGSAYEYELTYIGPDGAEETLYSSETVGGDESDGLKEATENALSDEDYLYLDSLAEGEEASVRLKVTMDGETEANAYFDTIGRLKLRFAVEPQPEPEPIQRTRTVGRVVRTGDDANLFPFYVAMALSGVLFTVLAIDSVRRRRKEKEEGVR